MKDCTNCFMAKFDRHPSGKRNLIGGECTANIVMPNSYMDYLGNFPGKRIIGKFTPKNCKMWINIKCGEK